MPAMCCRALGGSESKKGGGRCLPTKDMSGSFENVGWCKPGAEGLYNIYIMEELHSILSLGAGGSTKMVDPVAGRIERVFHAKFPQEYIQRDDKRIENREAFRAFHEHMLHGK